MRNSYGVDRDWMKYPVYVVLFIIACGFIGCMNMDLNNSYREDCAKAGGTFMENKYHSERSACLGGYR